jgi:hypothetical protein
LQKIEELKSEINNCQDVQERKRLESEIKKLEIEKMEVKINPMSACKKLFEL